MIKNIVFDIGNVVVEGKPKNALKYIDIDKGQKEIIERVVFDNLKWIDLDLGNDDFNSYFEKIKVDLPSDMWDISKEILMRSHEYRKFNGEIINLMKLLSNKYKIYILSDNNMDTFTYLKNTDLSKYVDGWCVSAVYKEVKANKKLFDIFFKVNKLSPGECYFIDDKFENISIANDFGMLGFVLDWEENKFDDLVEDMIQHNIELVDKL